MSDETREVLAALLILPAALGLAFLWYWPLLVYVWKYWFGP